MKNEKRPQRLENKNGKLLFKAANSSPKCLATPFNVNGVKWEIHNHDADINNPSCPHMHAIGKPWKLDLYTGCIYMEKGGALVGKIKRRELFDIWMAKGMLKIILAERAIYEELRKKDPIRYPELPPLPIKAPSQLQSSNSQKLLRTTQPYSSAKTKVNSCNRVCHRRILINVRNKIILRCSKDHF